MHPEEVNYDPYELLVSPPASPSHTSTSDSQTFSSHSTIPDAEDGCQNAGISEGAREIIGDKPEKRQKCSDFGLALDLDEGVATTMPTTGYIPYDYDASYGADSVCTDFQSLKPVFKVFSTENPKKKPARAAPQKRPRDENAQLERRNLQNCPLKDFSLNGKSMKHEFFVIKLTRKFVHSLKKAVKGARPKAKGLLYVLSQSQTAENKMKAFITFVFERKECFVDLIKPDDMPMSDCKDVRKNNSEFSSYSKGFFAYFMGRSAYLRVAFDYFCEVVFEGTPEVLSRAWGMTCCASPCGHDCEEKWSRMKQYTQSDLLKELGLTPLD
jgi:hypothetical protein